MELLVVCHCLSPNSSWKQYMGINDVSGIVEICCSLIKLESTWDRTPKVLQ